MGKLCSVWLMSRLFFAFCIYLSRSSSNVVGVRVFCCPGVGQAPS